MKRLRIGTRRSELAMAQARWTAERLQAAWPGLLLELVPMLTSGDKAASAHPNAMSPHRSSNVKAMFTKEIEEALLAGTIDVAVHSMKDLAAEMPDGLTIAAVPAREDPRDAWVSKTQTPFHALERGASVATSSVRRQAQVRHLRPDVTVAPMRGNVDTRLRKLREGSLDGLIIAAAGLRRLGRIDEATEILPETVMLPAVGQGCLALQCRRDRSDVMQRVKSIDHPNSRYEGLAERACLKALGGDCQTPIAALAHADQGRISISALVLSLDGKQTVRQQAEGPVEEAQALGTQTAQQLLAQGASALLTEL